jgi:hypothetical protein
MVERHRLARRGERVMRRLRVGVRRRIDDPGGGQGRRGQVLSGPAEGDVSSGRPGRVDQAVGELKD